MNSTAKIAWYEIRDVYRGKWLLLYGAFFFVLTEGLFRFTGDGSRVLLSLVSLVLLLVPLVGVLFGTVYLYGAREFNELLLAQPVNRRQMFGGLYLGLALPLASAMLLGVGCPFLLHGVPGDRELITLLFLLGTGTALTLVFVALAFVIAISVTDRLKGLGAAIVLWLAFSFLYDGLVLMGVRAFADYPLEKGLIAAVLLNPVDLGRVLLLMRMDVAALMGYTGATFEAFFGTAPGLALAGAALAVWVAAPVLLGFRLFSRRIFKVPIPEKETATKGLREEHVWILKVTGVLEVILDREPGHGLDYDAVEECVSFIRLFADACHHGQEEDLLFPELEARGMPRDAGPLAVMLQEHEMGRAYVGHMRKALPEAKGGDEDARLILVNSGRGYIQLIRDHILKEDNVLFNFADQMVTGGACDRLCKDYGVVCRSVFEGKTKQELEAMAENLLDRYGGD